MSSLLAWTDLRVNWLTRLLWQQVRCRVTRAQARYGTDGDEMRMSDADERSVVIPGLHSGSEYTCSVKANTGAGYGPATMKTFFTLPPGQSSRAWACNGVNKCPLSKTVTVMNVGQYY